MRVVRFVAVLLALFVLTVWKVSASGFENTGVGMKARGMAGAFRAIADDWTAAYYNPAGYAFILDNQLGGNAAFVHFRDEITPNYRWGGSYETGMFNDSPIYNKHEILSLPSAGFIVRLPIWGETVLGLSAYQPFDYNVTWTLYDLPGSYNDSLFTPADQYRNNLDVVAFQLTAAREFVEDEMSLGIGLQILRGDLLFNSLVFRENPLKALGDSTVELWSRPRDKITQWNHNDGYGWGFGIKTGALWKVNEQLNLAATISVPFNITITGTSTSEFYLPKRTELIHSSADPFVNNPARVGYLFLSGSQVVDNADFETTLKLPPSVAIGLAYTINEKLTFALDAEYTFWSRFDGFDFTYTNHRGLKGTADTAALARDFFTADLSFPVTWEDAGKVQFGASYRHADLITLLAGVSADQSPARNADRFSPLFIDTGTKYGFNGGFIFHLEQWDLGITSSYIWQPDMTASVPATFGQGEEMVHFPGEYKAATYETILSFNYRF
jgi:long-chain fatty acid transport protein